MASVRRDAFRFAKSDAVVVYDPEFVVDRAIRLGEVEGRRVHEPSGVAVPEWRAVNAARVNDVSHVLIDKVAQLRDGCFVRLCFGGCFQDVVHWTDRSCQVIMCRDHESRHEIICVPIPDFKISAP